VATIIEPATPVPSHLRDIFRLAVPAMIALASQPLLGIGDTAMIGRLGTEPLAARAIGAAVVAAIYWIFAFLSFGTTTLVGRHYGAHDPKSCGETYLDAVAVALLGGIGVACAGLVFAPQLYGLMGAEASVINAGVPYFRIYIASAPFTFIFFASVGFFRGVLDAKTPMLIAFLVAAVHLILDYGLIYGNFGLPRLGLAGAAIAASAAQFTGAVICLRIFFLSRSTAPYRTMKWRMSLRRARPLFRIGGDLAVRTGALRGSLVFATSTAARVGADVLSAHEIAFHLFILGSDITDGLAVAGQALVAKHLGAGQKDKAYAMGRRGHFTRRLVSTSEWDRVCAGWSSHRGARHPLPHVGDAHRRLWDIRADLLDVASLALGVVGDLVGIRRADVMAFGHADLSFRQPKMECCLRTPPRHVLAVCANFTVTIKKRIHRGDTAYALRLSSGCAAMKNSARGEPAEPCALCVVRKNPFMLRDPQHERHRSLAIQLFSRSFLR
jgi:putative MATE family efflux protein